MKGKSRRKDKVPPYRRQHRPNGLDTAIVEINGRRVSLGRWGTPESKERYRQALAEADAKVPIGDQGRNLTVADLVARYWQFIDVQYANQRHLNSPELHHHRTALAPLIEIYAALPVEQFGPVRFKAVREAFVKRGWSRGYVNEQAGRIKRLFRWATENELAPPSIYQALTAVAGLRSGRTEAPDYEPVEPVEESDIEAVKPFVARQVWALIQLQLLTGARAGELVGLRAVDIDTGGSVWTYKPARHKTAHHGINRTILFGPKARAALAEFMRNRAVDKPLFSPKEAERERHDRATMHRRPDQTPNGKKTEREIGDAYTVPSYRRAIEYGCRKAGIARWTPHRLRHTCATKLREIAGIDLAQGVLGHRLGSRITEIYSQASIKAAMELIERVG